MLQGIPVRLQPVDQAPTKTGSEFGPCLLCPGFDGAEWTIGRWNGRGWYDEDGFPLTPIVFAILPALASLIPSVL